LIAGITGGGIAAVVVCGTLLGAALIGGGGLAYAQIAEAETDTPMNNNTGLYTPSGNSGDNVLHNPDQG